MNPLRWGILSTAGIARKNWRAIRDSGNSIVTAVASRDAARGAKFIAEMQLEHPFATTPAALGSYEEIIASSQVDAIYIPLPTALRKEWVLRAAAAGKHVLCEKPCGVSLADVREMTAACAKHHVQFMDGVMFMHNPRLARMRGALDDAESVGPIKRIMSVFSFPAGEDFFDANIRVHSELEPAGCLGDLGWYCIRFSLWAMNWQLPREVSGRILTARGNRLSPGAPPVDFSGELIFDQGASAGFYNSFRAAHQNWAHIGGAKGYLRVAGFVQPESTHEPAFELNNVRQVVKCCDCGAQHDDSRTMAQEVHMIRNFTNQVQSGKLNDDWPMWALKTQQVMDACFESARNGSRTVQIGCELPAQMAARMPRM
jgi:predicted dehydrogenase